jgi:Tol biopolymer transport system component
LRLSLAIPVLRRVAAHRSLASLLTTAALIVAACQTADPSPPASPAASATAVPTPGASPSDPAVAGPVPHAGTPIVYQAEGLATIDPDGTDKRLLFAADGPPDPAHADWSPDGSRIAFQAGTDGQWEIWVAGADGSNARVLVACVSPCITLDAPAWSPDGRSIAFSRLDEIDGELPSRLQVVDVASGAVTTVAEVESGGYLNEPRWSPDGRSLVHTWEDHHGPDGVLAGYPTGSAIAIVDLDDTAAGPEPLTGFDAFAGFPDWHPTADLIVFQAGASTWWDAIEQSESNIHTIRPDGSDRRQLTSYGPDDPVVWLPSWSGDGSSILVTMTERANRAISLGWLSADGARLQPFPGPVGGAHGRQQRVGPPS